LEPGFVTEEVFDGVVDPAKMVRPCVATSGQRKIEASGSQKKKDETQVN
jgi:hypothetical protein